VAGRTMVKRSSPLPKLVLEHHLTAFVRPEPSSPLLVGEKGGRLGRHPLNDAWSAARSALGRPEIHFHDLRGAGLTLAATQGATTRELMARAGHASPASALRYQHATADRDTAIAAALSGLAESARSVSLGNGPQDIREMNDSTRKEEEASQRSELDPTRERPTGIEPASSAGKAPWVTCEAWHFCESSSSRALLYAA
jgi:hypothetical protein